MAIDPSRLGMPGIHGLNIACFDLSLLVALTPSSLHPGSPGATQRNRQVSKNDLSDLLSWWAHDAWGDGEFDEVIHVRVKKPSVAFRRTANGAKGDPHPSFSHAVGCAGRRARYAQPIGAKMSRKETVHPVIKLF
jgi:hypothetical protein